MARFRVSVGGTVEVKIRFGVRVTFCIVKKH